MKIRINFAIISLVFFACAARAAVHYVSQSSTAPASPFTGWSTAATNIQDAIDAASPGDQVLVSNGVYQTGGRPVSPYLLTNRVVIPIPITVQSVGGPALTIIQGNPVPGSNAVRCVHLTNGASLIGFTLTQGATRTTLTDNITFEWSGGGVWGTLGASPLVSNCVFLSNSATYYGGGSYGCTLYNCSIISNTAYYGGGSGNSALNNCVLNGNAATNGGGGGGYGCTMTNCLVYNNSTVAAGGGATSGHPLVNCTIVSNSAVKFGGGVTSCDVSNSIVYYNNAPSNANYYTDSTLKYSCTMPQVDTRSQDFTNAPLFVDLANGNFRLQSNSPCINSGTNLPALPATDLDGNPRLVGSFVDAGAYEYQSPASLLPYAWLYQYGFATDGSADNADADGDGLSNLQEWRAGTDPTNAAFVFKILSVSNTTVGISSGLAVTWKGGANKTYSILRSTNLAAPGSFVAIKTNVFEQGPAGELTLITNRFVDTTATNTVPYFYRVGVQ